MNIAVIDDSIDDARQLAGFVSTYFSDAHISQKTTIFNTAADFLNIWHTGGYDLVFIDIYLKGEASGIRIAERIRRDDDQCTIIFTTSSTDFALKGYEVRALDYMLKPLRYGKFCQTMDYFRSVSQRKRSHYIEVKESRIMVKLPVDDILYTDSSLLLCYPQFICCYRNCIINMDKVTSLEKAEFVLNTGEHLPITRTLRPQIHQHYADYQFQKLNGGI